MKFPRALLFRRRTDLLRIWTADHMPPFDCMNCSRCRIPRRRARDQIGSVPVHARHQLGVHARGLGQLEFPKLGGHARREGGRRARVRRIRRRSAVRAPDSRRRAEADGDGHHLRATERRRDVEYVRVVQGDLDTAAVIDPLRHLEPKRPRHAGRRSFRNVEAVQVIALLAPDLQHVAESRVVMNAAAAPRPSAIALVATVVPYIRSATRARSRHSGRGPSGRLQTRPLSSGSCTCAPAPVRRLHHEVGERPTDIDADAEPVTHWQASRRLECSRGRAAGRQPAARPEAGARRR